MCFFVELKALIVIYEEVMMLTAVGIVLCVFIDIYLKFKMPQMVAVRWVRQEIH